MSIVREVLFKKVCEINAVMKRNDSNCIGILSNQREAETASYLSEYTIRILKDIFAAAGSGSR